MNVVRASLRYFLIVFAAGFVLGTARTLWLAPRVGERSAELLEMPVMLAISWFAARHVVRRVGGAFRPLDRVATGMLALIMLLATEFAVVVTMSGQDLVAYLRERDPVAGIAYAISLLVFAALPALVRVRGRGPG